MLNLRLCSRTRTILVGVVAALFFSSPARAVDLRPFGEEFPSLDSHATGAWWEADEPALMVPRDEVLAFALYTHDHGVLKLTAQLYPLLPDEPREVRLELQQGGQWHEVSRQPVQELGWSAHFRVEPWDATQTVPYRVRLGDQAEFAGRIRRDPIDKDEIVVGTLSCNSSRTPGPRARIIENLKRQDPDLLFFAGDQSYHHTQHTFGWLEFGGQFRDVLRDRPVVTIPDDHDVGQANLWGENGKQATTPRGHRRLFLSGRVRQHGAALPDMAPARSAGPKADRARDRSLFHAACASAASTSRSLEDRKFKSGPEGKIPKMGPRPDHINDPTYDRAAVDLPGLELLGDRQLAFLNAWGQDWSGSQMKCVLSQTAFCGAVHLHGTPRIACWPTRLQRLATDRTQPGACRRSAVPGRPICAATSTWRSSSSTASASSATGRTRLPARRSSTRSTGAGGTRSTSSRGAARSPESPLPWTGDYFDGLGNRITMLAYANPGRTAR